MNMTDHPDDTSVLVGLAAAGDRTAWVPLVQRFSRLVWSVARSYGLTNADAEDVFQTTWLRLAEHLGRINDPDRVGGWLATTARREALRLIAARARTVLTTDLDVLDHAREDVTPEQAVLDMERQKADNRRLREVWEAFGHLPQPCQRLLRLLIASPPLRYAEIAVTLDIAVGSIGPTRGRCLQRLRTLLAEPNALHPADV
jgi:RNA polymerase sigma factor (sigma-70 family)